MHVLLVRPLKEADFHYLCPDIGLGYLSTALKRQGHTVELLDLQLALFRRQVTAKSAIDLLLQKQADVIGFKALNLELPFARAAAAALKAQRPERKLIVGGPASSGLQDQIFKHLPAVDFAFRGEAEIGFPALLANLEPGGRYEDIPGLIWRENGQVRQNPQIFTEDLDSLGPIDWELLNPPAYPTDWSGGDTKFPIMATRGCPYTCNYCQGHTICGRKFRTRSVEAVIDEIQFLQRRFGLTSFSIADDNFTFNREYSVRFAETLLSRNIKLKWHCHNALRVETLDVELMRLFEKAGCYYARVAIESGSQRVLDLMNRRSNLERIKEIITQIAANTHIRMMAFFILGYPGETVEEAKMSIDLACRLPLDRAGFFNFTPLPGTVIYQRLQAEGLLENFDIEKNALNVKPLVAFSHSPRTLHWLKLKGLLRFYLRPRVIKGLLADIESFEHFRRLLQRVTSVVFGR